MAVNAVKIEVKVMMMGVVMIEVIMKIIEQWWWR